MFLAYVEENRGCSVREACEHVGIRRHQVRALKRADSEFADDYREARGYGDERIRNEIARRAIDGVEDPITNKDGEIVGHRIVYSDRLLGMMAKAHLPEYRESRQIELTGRDGGPLEVENPDVAAAIDRFTGTIRRLTERAQSSGTIRAAAGDRTELAAPAAGD
jgi:hypothetical protein